jgi:hypothetical protein
MILIKLMMMIEDGSGQMSGTIMEWDAGMAEMNGR